MDIDFILSVEERAAALEQLDYFEVLRIPSAAGADDVKAAYHRESRVYHPDRYAALPSLELRELIGRIYRRVNEAYTVLRDDAKRQRYLADVTGPERAKKLRFTEAEEAAVKDEQKRKVEEQYGRTPNGRRLYATALKDAEAQRWDAAERSLRAALMYEPANAKFRELLERVEKSKPKSDPFKIR
jgi:curved DNA-binding protein CbpA